LAKPEVYLDMDGVIADFFAEYAKLAGINSGNYRDIPPAKVDPTLDKMVGTDFFYRLPKFGSADALIDMIVKTFGHYHICSSPLRGDHAGSEKYKTMWIKKNLPIQPKNIYITPNKAKYAVQPDGTPNILIDDRGSNITAWEAKGGVGIKYQADEDGLGVVVAGFKRAINIIKGKEKHEPQQLKSLDRGKMIAVQKSGDSDEEQVKESKKHMRIKDLLNEFVNDFPTGLSIGGEDVTVGDIKDFAKEYNLNKDEMLELLRGIKKAHSIANKEIPIPMTDKSVRVGDVAGKALDAASLLALRGAGRGLPSLLKTAGKVGTRQAASQAVKKVTGIEFDPPSLGRKGGEGPPIAKKKKRIDIGDLVTITMNDQKFKVPVVGVNPSGYVVDISSIPGKRAGETATVPDKSVAESSSAPITSGNIASLGNSPHVAGGSPAVLKRWSGEPGSSGTTGKSIKHKPMKSQTAKDNPVTNPNVGNNLIA
jgi:hypothetical protein